MNELHGVVDVESVGLYGEGFAVAMTVINRDSEIIDTVYFGCPIDTAQGDLDDRVWVKNNVCPYLPKTNCFNPYSVRNNFWKYYQGYCNKENTSFTLWADCGYPVEALFLAACVKDDINARKWNGAYPLQEIATIRTAVGLDSTLAYELSIEEKHNPVTETQYIAPKLIRWLNTLRK